MKEKGLLYLFVLISFYSCVWQNGEIKVQIKNPIISIAHIKLANHQFIISGRNLHRVSAITIKEDNSELPLTIESQTKDEIVTNTTNNVRFEAGRVFEFILSSANAATTFTVNFSLCDSTLNNKEFDCNITAVDKDVLSYDANLQKWVPRNINGLSYQGTFNATPGFDPAGGSAGDYYIISAAGTIGTTAYAIGDWITFNGADWEKISNSSVVTSVFSRTGVITAAEGDYNLNQLLDVDLTTTPPTNGNVLQYNGTHWVPASMTGGGGGGGGSVTSVSGTLPISVASGTTTPVISIATAASGVAGALSSTAFDTFNNKLGPTLNSGQVYIGNGSNVATATTLTGDVTVSNAGVMAVGAGKITNAMLAGSIDLTSKVTGALPIANGGTAATTAAGARANLGLVIGPGVGELIAFTTSMSCLPYEKLQVSSAPYFMTCVIDNGNTNYALLAGRASGQTLNGGTAASENLVLQSTAHTTKGFVLMNSAGGNVGVGTSTPSFALSVGDGVANDGAILARGYGVVGTDGQTLTAAGAGTRMIWYPKKAAFRVGNVSSTQWDDVNIGLNSMAMGYSTKATGSYSVALGTMTTASGIFATATGRSNTASGSSSMTMGSGTMASGTYSTASGENSIASGSYSFSSGTGSAASGNTSMAIGDHSTSRASRQISFGAYNMFSGTENASAWVATDPLWVIGNGTGAGGLRSTALTMLKNGKLGIGVSGPTTELQVAGIISPDANGTRDLGTASLKFKDIYANNNVIQTSDVRFKKNIKNSDLGLDFINRLRPVSYQWKEGADKSLHYGLIAQETKKALAAPNTAIVTQEEESDQYGIRYTELISPLIKAVQDLYKKLLTAEEENRQEKILISKLVHQEIELKKQNEEILKLLSEVKNN